MENKALKVSATVAFPSLTRPNAMSGKYSVQLANLSDAACEKLEELGIVAKFKEDNYGRGRFIECKSAFPIDNSKFQTVIGDDGLPMDAALVGPGSKVEVILKPFEWTMGAKSGVSPRLVKMVVREVASAQTADNNFDDMEAL